MSALEDRQFKTGGQLPAHCGHSGSKVGRSRLALIGRLSMTGTCHRSHVNKRTAERPPNESAKKVFVSEISTERDGPGSAAILSQPVRGRVCFSQPGQRFFDFLSRRVCALDVLDNLAPQLREHFSAIYVPVSRSFKVEGRKPHGRRFQLAGSRIRNSDFRSVVRPFAVWLILHIATRTDRRFRLERKRLEPERNVGERRSDRLDGTSGLSGGHTPSEQHHRHLGELPFYTQGLLPRDLLQQFISTTGGAALAFRFANSGTMAAGDRSS